MFLIEGSGKSILYTGDIRGMYPHKALHLMIHNSDK